MIKTIQFSVLAMCISVGSVYAETGKAQIIGEFQKLQSQIFDIAKQNQLSEPKAQIRNKIDQIISENLSSDQLYRIGIVAYVSGIPGTAGDNKIDNVFFYASNRCAYILSKRTGDQDRYYLREMKRTCGKDGGEAIFYNNLLDKQNSMK